MCNCKKRASFNCVWTDGTDTVVYTTEIAAKAKVIRAGGTYTSKPV